MIKIKYYHNADIYLQPSVTANGEKEGIPGTLIEAMASGLRVISTFHAGIPYIIENEVNGLLVKENDINGIAVSILRLVNDEKLRENLGNNTTIKASKELDLVEKTKELENIYSSLLTNRN